MYYEHKILFQKNASSATAASMQVKQSLLWNH
jgi:hypothetical protein